MKKFVPKPPKRVDARVICCRLSLEDAKRFDRLCRKHKMKPGTMAKQMLVHCLNTMENNK